MVKPAVVSRVTQPELPRAVCMSAFKGQTCTLLVGHSGKCTSAQGRQW